MNKGTKIAVCIPSGGLWEPAFGMSLTSLIREVCFNPSKELKGAAVEVFNSRGSILPQVRYSLLRSAMRKGATHVLFLDDDMIFPCNTLHRLLALKKTFVAAAGVTKEKEPVVAAQGLNEKPLELKGEGVEEVRHVGLACALIDLAPVKSLNPPFFTMEWRGELNAYAGEDVFFCNKWREKGEKIWVLKSLSRELGHVGSKVFQYG